MAASVLTWRPALSKVCPPTRPPGRPAGPGTRYLVPGTRYQVPVPGTRYLVPSTWYQVPGTRYLVTILNCS